MDDAALAIVGLGLTSSVLTSLCMSSSCRAGGWSSCSRQCWRFPLRLTSVLIYEEMTLVRLVPLSYPTRGELLRWVFHVLVVQ